MLIRVHLAGGAVESFTQDDPDKIRIMWQSVDPARLFTQHRLVIAGAYSKAVFVCSEINRIDFIQNDCACWEFPQGYSDVVELSESDFRKRAHLDQPDSMARRDQPTPAGDLLVSFLKLRFRNGPPIFAMIEVSVKLPVENQSFMRFLLSKTGFHMRLQSGGTALVNLANLAGYLVYPGVAQIPSDSWIAETADDLVQA
jgi:hypothetical protein